MKLLHLDREDELSELGMRVIGRRPHRPMLPNRPEERSFAEMVGEGDADLVDLLPEDDAERRHSFPFNAYVRAYDRLPAPPFTSEPILYETD